MKKEFKLNEYKINGYEDIGMMDENGKKYFSVSFTCAYGDGTVGILIACNIDEVELKNQINILAEDKILEYIKSKSIKIER